MGKSLAGTPCTTRCYKDPLCGVECYTGHRNWVGLGFRRVATAKTTFDGIETTFYKDSSGRYAVVPNSKDLYEINFKCSKDFAIWWKHHKDSYRDLIILKDSEDY